jgi:hypothetical protein
VQVVVLPGLVMEQNYSLLMDRKLLFLKKEYSSHLAS